MRYQGAAAEAPAKLLRLWSYESNQFARLVRTWLWLLMLLIRWLPGHALDLCPHLALLERGFIV